MLFCKETDETIWKPPPLSKRTPLPTNPFERFFNDSPLCSSYKNKKPLLNREGGEVRKYKMSAPFLVVEAKSHVFNIHIV